MERGSIVKFHTPFPDENPEQEYVLLFIYPEWTQEFKDGSYRTYPAKADIGALDTGFHFTPISSVLLSDLVEVDNVKNYAI